MVQLVGASLLVVGAAAVGRGSLRSQNESVGPVVRASVAGLHHAAGAEKLALRWGIILHK